MDILVIILIIFSVFSKLLKATNGKGGKASRPGSAPRPVSSGQTQPTQPIRPTPSQATEPWPARPETEVPPMPQAETAPAEAETGSFWQQMSEAIRAEMTGEEVGAPARGHEAVGDMAEGDSRECEHGSLGGSMAYESHEGGSLVEEETRRLGQFVQTEAKDSLYNPSMNAQQMRQAIVMAEILKRPAERRAEQARRWSTR